MKDIRLNILIITLSDRASNGEYEDKSGPEIKQLIHEFCYSLDWLINTTLLIIPDNAEMLKHKLEESQYEFDLIFTTGGTGIGPRDITPDVVKPMLDKEIPGIMEMIRIKYGSENPNAIISRAVAGIMGKSLIFTLPGSPRAVNQYMREILKTLEHMIYMQRGIDAH